MPNEQMREHWTRFGGPAWSANRHIFEAVLAPIFDALLKTVGPVQGLDVLDIGCGTGGLAAAIAARGGRAVGVDISESMVDSARALHPAARFVAADVQVADLRPLAPEGFDVAASEFGVMFFEDPVAAFANVAAATKPGGRLAFACWRDVAENPMFTLGIGVLEARMPAPPGPPSPRSPGPTAFAESEYVREVLGRAGWGDVAVEPFDATVSYGIDGSDGIEERLTIIQNGMTGRMAEEQLRPALGAAGWAALLDEVRAELRRHLVDGVVAFPAAIWLVTASNGG